MAEMNNALKGCWQPKLNTVEMNSFLQEYTIKYPR